MATSDQRAATTTTGRYLIRRLSDTPTERGVCGWRKTLITHDDTPQANVSHLTIDNSRYHYHKEMVEYYYVLTGGGTITLDGEKQPITAGEDGYWTNFDWDDAFQRADTTMGLKYSGNYGFTETWMYWPTTHMVQPKENALQCTDCHAENGRLDWEALGYPGDPMEWGGRFGQ